MKVLDFGIARADIDREGDTRSAQYGTARYMAPEIWLDGRVSSAVDIYALGVTLLELLRGEHFERPALLRALFETAVREAIDAAIPNRTDPFSTELRALLASMMAYEVGDDTVLHRLDRDDVAGVEQVERIKAALGVGHGLRQRAARGDLRAAEPGVPDPRAHLLGRHEPDTRGETEAAVGGLGRGCADAGSGRRVGAPRIGGATCRAGRARRAG